MTLRLRFRDPEGAPVQLGTVMGAYAHLVAFDEAVSGYAHLHPKFAGTETNPEPELVFAFNTQKPGNYRVWAQYATGGTEYFTPFEIEVSE